MKLDLKLLSMRFSQTKDEPLVPTEGVNPYLLEKILLPCMNNGIVYLRDIDYGAFTDDDIDSLQSYYNSFSRAGRQLQQFMETVQKLPPEAHRTRTFC